MTLVKLSILMLYHFIFATRKFRRACIAVAGLCLVWFFVTLFLGLFQCKPISGAWDISLLLSGQAQCFTYGNYMIGYELTNVLLDITILALPLWVIKTLHLPPSRKVLVGSIFVLGGL